MDQNMTRNRFEKYYFPKNLDFNEYKKIICVPPKSILIPIKLGEDCFYQIFENVNSLSLLFSL